MTRFDPEHKSLNFPGLTGSVVVLTGGAQGIGRATVQRLHARGAKVVFGDIDSTAGQELVTVTSAESIHFLKTDVRLYQDNLALCELHQATPQWDQQQPLPLHHLKRQITTPTFASSLFTPRPNGSRHTTQEVCILYILETAWERVVNTKSFASWGLEPFQQCGLLRTSSMYSLRPTSPLIIVLIRQGDRR